MKNLITKLYGKEAAMTLISILRKYYTNNLKSINFVYATNRKKKEHTVILPLLYISLQI